MKLLPYQIVAVVSLMISFFIGAFMNVGADIIRQQAQADFIMSVPVSYLSKIDTSNSDI